MTILQTMGLPPGCRIFYVTRRFTKPLAPVELWINERVPPLKKISPDMFF
jgi:hypothetical protein